jgi:hypothetical protein
MAAATYSEVKVQAAVLDYRLDWSAWLGTDTIASSTWTVTGATKNTENNTTTTSTVRVSAGSAGTPATALCTITTTAGYIEVRSIELQIVSALVAREVLKAPGATMAIPAPTWSDLGSDTISTYTWSAAAGLTIASGGSTATVVVSGGTAGVDYALTITITTTGGQTDARVITVQVRDR